MTSQESAHPDGRPRAIRCSGATGTGGRERTGRSPPPGADLLGAGIAFCRELGAPGSRTRKPWFLISLPGFLMLRYAARVLSASFQELPPRITRLAPLGARPLDQAPKAGYYGLLQLDARTACASRRSFGRQPAADPRRSGDCPQTTVRAGVRDARAPATGRLHDRPAPGVNSSSRGRSKQEISERGARKPQRRRGGRGCGPGPMPRHSPVP